MSVFVYVDVEATNSAVVILIAISVIAISSLCLFARRIIERWRPDEAEPEEELSSKNVQANGGGIHLEVQPNNGSNGNPSDQKVPSRFIKYEPKS